MGALRRLLRWLIWRQTFRQTPQEPPDWLLPKSLEERRQEIEADLRHLNRKADLLLQRQRRQP
jgi:hypothetical protein